MQRTISALSSPPQRSCPAAVPPAPQQPEWAEFYHASADSSPEGSAARGDQRQLGVFGGSPPVCACHHCSVVSARVFLSAGMAGPASADCIRVQSREGSMNNGKAYERALISLASGRAGSAAASSDGRRRRGSSSTWWRSRPARSGGSAAPPSGRTAPSGPIGAGTRWAAWWRCARADDATPAFIKQPSSSTIGK